ncbi:MAG: hypothetical protein R3E96_05135 [Planctomycetota bacterium]
MLALLDRLGIGDKLYERLESLSGGEQQRWHWRAPSTRNRCCARR